MRHAFVFALILGYIFLTAFLEMGAGGRIVIGDIMLVLLMLLAIAIMVSRRAVSIPVIYLAALPMLFVFLLGSIFARYADRSVIELVVIVFGLFGSVVILNLSIMMPADWPVRLAQGYVVVIGLLSILCLIDFLIMPGLISSRQLGGLQGPFRNTGQAGSFFGVHGAIMLALILGRVVPSKPIYVAAVTVTLLALVLTFKRASMIAMVLGLFVLMAMMLFSQSKRDKKIGTLFLISLVILAPLGLVVFTWALDAVPGMRWRFEYKISADAVTDFADSFLLQNIEATFAALRDSPLVGVGLNNVYEVYMSHEIHSTYLGILAYSGIFGSLAYLFFITTLLYQIYAEARHKMNNAWAAFLYYLLPLLMGQMVGWAYTIHIRKREFWILMFFVAMAILLSRKMRHYGQQRSRLPKV